jgi:hypothetical protein
MRVDFIGRAEFRSGDKYCDGIALGSIGDVDIALTSSHTGPPNLGNLSHGFHGPINAPFLSMAVNPLKFFSIPARMSW